MDTELVRFRIDPELRDKAADVCAGLGLELNDVLRTLVTRIARDGALPFELGAVSPRAAPERAPFHEYDARLWSPIKPQVDAEVAMSILARFIAQTSALIYDAAGEASSDPQRINRLTRERDAALKLRRELDVADPAAVDQVLNTYGPLVRGHAG